MMENMQVAFIGGGHITEIILSSLKHRKLIPPERLVVSDRDAARLDHLAQNFGVRTTPSNVEAAQQGNLVLVNVRPEVVRLVLPDLQEARLGPDQILISLAAGVPLSQYAGLGEKQPLVRALPNPPSQVGQGVAALAFTPQVTPEQRQAVNFLFAALGKIVEVEETYLNAVTSLSSPVETLLFFQALIEAGVRCGLPRQVSTEVAAQTIMGSMEMWRSRQVSPSELIAEASTPGGVSVESLFVLEQRAFKAAIIEAVSQGAARAAALGRPAPPEPASPPPPG